MATNTILEFINFFCVQFADMFKDYPVKQRKLFSHQLYLLLPLKHFGSQGSASSAIHVKDEFCPAGAKIISCHLLTSP